MKVCRTCGEKFDAPEWRCPECGDFPRLRDGYVSFLNDLNLTSDCFKADYFSSIAEFEKNNFWFTSRNQLIVWVLKKYFPKVSNFLEIGCGTGIVLSYISKVFPECFLSGSDLFSQGLDLTKAQVPKATVFQMDARSIPFADEFDVIGVFDILEHIEEDSLVLREIHKALTHRGGIIITVPQHMLLWSPLDEIAFHKRRYSKTELTNKIEAAGFKILMNTSFVTLLLPAMLLSRLLLRFSNKTNISDNCLYESRLLPFVNTFFGKIRRIENLALKKGVRFPIGGSLLCVARKE